jgi:hypothetical protein
MANNFSEIYISTLFYPSLGHSVALCDIKVNEYSSPQGMVCRFAGISEVFHPRPTAEKYSPPTPFWTNLSLVDEYVCQTHKSVRYVPVTFWCNDKQKLQIHTLLTCGFDLRTYVQYWAHRPYE